jgi:hypothetical protein
MLLKLGIDRHAVVDLMATGSGLVVRYGILGWVRIKINK